MYNAESSVLAVLLNVVTKTLKARSLDIYFINQ